MSLCKPKSTRINHRNVIASCGTFMTAFITSSGVSPFLVLTSITFILGIPPADNSIRSSLSTADGQPVVSGKICAARTRTKTHQVSWYKNGHSYLQGGIVHPFPLADPGTNSWRPAAMSSLYQGAGQGATIYCCFAAGAPSDLVET